MEQKHAMGRAMVTFFPEMKDRSGETGYVGILLFSQLTYDFNIFLKWVSIIMFI